MGKIDTFLRKSLDFSSLFLFRRKCPICLKYSHKFKSHGYSHRKDARCGYCGALERHRLVWLYIQRKTNLFDGKCKRMLHFAPQKCLESKFRTNKNLEYITTDLNNSRVMIKMDITNIQFPDNYFDVIYCSHVLEHIPNDQKALQELFRVLNLGGWAIIIVPITADSTFEDPSINDPNERLELFGQKDHVRRYGDDIVERIGKVGFNVEVITATDILSINEMKLFGLFNYGGKLFYCTKGGK